MAGIVALADKEDCGREPCGAHGVLQVVGGLRESIRASRPGTFSSGLCLNQINCNTALRFVQQRRTVAGPSSWGKVSPCYRFSKRDFLFFCSSRTVRHISIGLSTPGPSCSFLVLRSAPFDTMASSSSAFSVSISQAQHGNLEMLDCKAPHVTIGDEKDDGVPADHLSEGDDEPVDATLSTSNDRYQMHRMGKEQVLVRHFRPMATFSFNAMATCVWEFGIFSITQGITDGGRAGLIWMTAIHAIGFTPVILSMAEMASIAPTAGGRYHWVSEFAHPKLQKPLSYITGWASTAAWQAGNAIGVFLTGTLIQVIILENNKSKSYSSEARPGRTYVSCLWISICTCPNKCH